MVKGRGRLNLRGFQVFDAIARHRSVTAAAAELGITQSAASHQLRTLTERLGEPLVERRGRAIALTEAGRKLAASLDGAFDIIEQSATALAGGSRPVVRIGLYSSFAQGWFIPRMPDFLARHPDIDLRLVMLFDPHEVSGRIADIFVTSEPVRLGYSTTRLFAERLLPVAAPGAGPVDDGAMPATLISSDVEPTLAGRDWRAFAVLNHGDGEITGATRWLYCSHYVLSLDLVLAGAGAALLPDTMVAPLLARGAVRRLPGKALPTGLSYDVQVRHERRGEPPIAAVTSWLREAARATHFPD